MFDIAALKIRGNTTNAMKFSGSSAPFRMKNGVAGGFYTDTLPKHTIPLISWRFGA